MKARFLLVFPAAFLTLRTFFAPREVFKNKLLGHARLFDNEFENLTTVGSSWRI